MASLWDQKLSQGGVVVWAPEWPTDMYTPKHPFVTNT